MAKLSASKMKERELILKCIQLYRDLPALWNVKSKVYRDREKKNIAYKILLSKYRELFPEATKDDVKRKINALRTNYRKELKKHLESVKTATCADSIYEPKLWYFSEMKFLQNYEMPCGSESSMDNIEDNDVEQNTECHVSTMDDTDDSSDHVKAHLRIIKRHKKRTNEEKLMDLAYESVSERKDEYVYWAMSCAADLQKMDRTQAIYAKKAIAEILMEGELGQLHRNSVKINESLPPA